MNKGNLLRLGLLTLSLLLILAGIFRGEADVVLQKAVNLCMECIGIG